MAGLSAVGPTLQPVAGWGLDIWERLGRIEHLGYLYRYRQGVPVAGDPKRGDWDEDLDAFTKESNVRAIATICRTLGGLGMRWGTDLGGSETATQLTELEERTAAIREHESWMRHHLEYGWEPGDAASGLRARARRHPDLVDWSVLSEQEREKDFGSVRSALRLLATLGYVPTRAAAYRRRPEQVTARVLTKRTTWTTTHGDRLVAAPGDWWLTSDTHGAGWSVRDDAFRAAYTRVAGDTYVARGADVTARRIRIGEAPEVVVSLEGPETARPGDWIVRDAAGNEWVIDAVDFEAKYAPVDER
jgi:hypothetical protein